MASNAPDQDQCAYVIGDDELARLRDEHAAAWLGWQRAHRRLSRQLEAALEQRHGLSLSSLELLGSLAAAPDRRRRLARLAEDVNLSISRVSRIVDSLCERGLVVREPCPEDARATIAKLTDEGLALARQAQGDHLVDVQEHFFDRLEGDEAKTLSAAFSRLAELAD